MRTRDLARLRRERCPALVIWILLLMQLCAHALAGVVAFLEWTFFSD